MNISIQKEKELQTQTIYVTPGERAKAKKLPKKSQTTSTPSAKLSAGSYKPCPVETNTLDPEIIITSTPTGNLNAKDCNSSQQEHNKSNREATTFHRDPI